MVTKVIVYRGDKIEILDLVETKVKKSGTVEEAISIIRSFATQKSNFSYPGDK